MDERDGLRDATGAAREIPIVGAGVLDEPPSEELKEKLTFYRNALRQIASETCEYPGEEYELGQTVYFDCGACGPCLARIALEKRWS